MGRSAIRLLCVGMLLAMPAAAAAEPSTPELIERAERGGRLDRSQAHVYRAYALAAPRRLPAAFRSQAPWDGTLELLRLRRDLPRLRQAAREEIESLLEPQASGEACDTESRSQTGTFTSTHFHITYDSVDGGLGVADYAASLERSWNTEVGAFGWAAPPVLVANPPPGGRYHVRIDDLGSGLYGFVSPVGTYAGFVGNNPATSWNDADAYATCMVLNRDYTGFPSVPQAALDSTTAHELNHSIQFGYGGLSGTSLPDDVFVEGGATWMEDEVHDDADDNHFYLWPLFQQSLGDYDGSPYPYWITFRGFTERYGTGVAGGGERVMQDFWELSSQNASHNQAAMGSALAARDTTLPDAFHAYAIAVKLNRACGGGYAYPYCFEEGPAYVSIAGATSTHATVANVGSSATSSVEDNYALAWVGLPTSSAPYDVTLANTSSGGQLRGTVVCDTGSGLSLFPLPAVAAAGQSRTLTGFAPSGCSSRVLVVTNQSQTAANPTTSTARSFQVSTNAAPPVTRTLAVTKTGSGAGTVTSNPAGINCGSDCSEDYAQGSSVTLGATPAPGSSFEGWSGDCTGSAGCTVAMSANRSVSAAFELIPDETPPQTTITAGPSGDTFDASPTFEFSSNEPSSSFSCQIDSAPAAPCSSPHTTSALAAGPHTFSVTATDPAGNADATPATRDFTVVSGTGTDLDPPETTITQGPSGETSDTTPTFAFGSDEQGSSFVCTIDHSLPAGCSSPHTTQELGSGTHVFSVYATDPAGNADGTPATRSFSVLASPPDSGTPAGGSSQGAPTTPEQPAPIPPPDELAPSIAGLRLAPAVFRAARSGPALAALVGTRVSFSLSEAASVRFRVARLLPGRRVGGRCVRQAAGSGRRPNCSRSTLLRASLVRTLPAGGNSFRYRGRLGGRALRPGRYRLIVRGRDAAGNLSARRRAQFVIVR